MYHQTGRDCAVLDIFSIVSRRHAVLPPESGSELARAAVPHRLGHPQHTEGGTLQQLCRPLQPSLPQPCVDRQTKQAAKSFLKCGGGEAGAAAQGRDREGLIQVFLHVSAGLCQRPDNLPPKRQGRVRSRFLRG